MTLQEARLTLRCDCNGDGSREEGIFRMYGDPDVTEFVRTGYIVGGRGSTVNSILQEATGGESQRRGVHLDLGGGVHGFQIDFRGWEDAKDANNQDVTWGDPSYSSPSVENATGADPLTQSNVFMKYLTVGEFDSRGGDEAVFEYGEWSDEGLFEPIDVVFEQQPQLTCRAEEDGFLNGTIFLVATQDISDLGHSALRGDR